MGNLSLSCFFGRNIMKSSNIGGQAVMEGIMMRHKDKYSSAQEKDEALTGIYHE